MLGCDAGVGCRVLSVAVALQGRLLPELAAVKVLVSVWLTRSPGLVSSRLRSPSSHTTMKLSPLRMSMSGPAGGVPGCCLRMGPAKPTGPTSALALPRLGPMVWLAGMCRRVGRHHVPPCWSARGVSEGRYPLPQRICVLLLAGRGWPIVAVERKEPVVVPKGEPRWQRRWCCLVGLGAAGRAPCPCCVWVVGCRGCVCGVLARSLSLSLSGAQSPISFLIHFSIKTLNPKP